MRSTTCQFILLTEFCWIYILYVWSRTQPGLVGAPSLFFFTCIPKFTVWFIDSHDCKCLHPLGCNLAGGYMESTWQQSRQRTWCQRDRFITPNDCFLHNKLILMGWRLTVVSQWEVLVITGRNLHSVISDHHKWQLNVVDACWGFSLYVKQVVLENGSQNIPKAVRSQRKLQVIKPAFRCRKGNDSKYVTMGYIGYYLISSVAVQWGGLCAWCLKMYELLAQEWDHPETTRVLYF